MYFRFVHSRVLYLREEIVNLADLHFDASSTPQLILRFGAVSLIPIISLILNFLTNRTKTIIIYIVLTMCYALQDYLIQSSKPPCKHYSWPILHWRAEAETLNNCPKSKRWYIVEPGFWSITPVHTFLTITLNQLYQMPVNSCTQSSG